MKVRARCTIGVDAKERRHRQPVLITMRIEVRPTRAARTDDIADTVDYAEVSRQVRRMAERSRFALLESLAESIARLCLQWTRVRKVRIVVEKPRALAFAASAGIEIVREK